MSQLLIQQYLNELSDLRRVSGTARESVVREAFKSLLKGWGRTRDLIFVPEYEYTTATKERRYIDGALLPELRVPFGYWEAKDEKDDLDAEIELKLRRGYPQDNIIFEDSREAVLIQNKQPVIRCGVENVVDLARLLGFFFDYERPEIAEFRTAVEQFKADLPAVLAALREMIESAERANVAFSGAAKDFLKHAQETINPMVTAADVREMLIQHILTEEIFSQIFDNSDFHHLNNVAKELYALEGTFFTGGVKRKTLDVLRPYYAAMKSAAALVSNHHEKQAFLKIVYENFYKVYNPKAADRLGVVYTPNEIVRFMIESADHLCQKHFGRSLIDENVEILDPAAGTGTFIAELIEHFRGQPAKLRHKYLEELHANEVAILPYYVANLNIEATYATLTGEYLEFPNLCFVDTLDNLGWSRTKESKGALGDLFGAVSDENVQRIKRQNARKISVIIGNPPYNANQLNENQNNKNREYPAIDKRIKETYIDASTAQKTKLYDMYARFFRWASDRIEENGIIAFVSNSSFLDSRTYDGFRKVLANEFNDIWVLDLKGNARTSGERRRKEGGNVFHDQIRVGVAIYFCVKKQGAKGCRIRYEAVRDYAREEEKREFLQANMLARHHFEDITPDRHGSWINQLVNDFEASAPVADKGTKSVKIAAQEKAIFKEFSLGVATNRDEWLFDFTKKALTDKVEFFTGIYEEVRRRWAASTTKVAINDFVDRSIKWTSELESHADKGTKLVFNPERIRSGLFRPFVKMNFYYDYRFVHRIYQQDQIYPIKAPFSDNVCICFSGVASNKPFQTLASQVVPSLDLLEKTQCLPRYRYLADDKKIDNITEWALEQFRSHYDKTEAAARSITKDAIFHYVYGILHDPIYREKYALNLRREFPRIPFYAEFWRWADWGQKLISLHTTYERVEPWPLRRVDVRDEKSRKAGLNPKTLLRADRDAGNIELDSETQLTGIPPRAWNYKLGNLAALDWILDQYREKTAKDHTIREKFSTFRFSDHKENVIDLLKHVTRVSVETMEIVDAMRAASGLK